MTTAPFQSGPGRSRDASLERSQHAGPPPRGPRQALCRTQKSKRGLWTSFQMGLRYGRASDTRGDPRELRLKWKPTFPSSALIRTKRVKGLARRPEVQPHTAVRTSSLSISTPLSSCSDETLSPRTVTPRSPPLQLLPATILLSVAELDHWGDSQEWNQTAFVPSRLGVSPGVMPPRFTHVVAGARISLPSKGHRALYL
ncbi:uncharacterized protein AAES06_005862 isoform 1-T1 [Glossophaga mutica]